MRKKIVILILSFILLFTIFALSCSAVVTPNTYETFPLGITSPYVIQSGYYGISFPDITTSMLGNGSNRIVGELFMEIIVPTSNGAINLLAKCKDINLGIYQDEFIVDTQIENITSYSFSGNVTAQEFNALVGEFSYILGVPDYTIYRHSTGFFDGIAIFGGMFLINDSYCTESIYNLWQNYYITEANPMFLVTGRYYFNFITGDQLNLPNSSLEINFISNGQSYSTISFQNNSVYYDSTLVFTSEGWVDNLFQYINYNSVNDYLPSSSNIVLQFLAPYSIQQSFNYGYDEGYEDGIPEGYVYGYNDGYSTGVQVGFDDGLEDNLTTNIFGNILNTLDSLTLFDTISVLDIITTLIGLFVFLFVLKLIAGG